MVDVAYKPVGKLKPIYTGGTLTPPKFMPTYYEWLSMKGLQIRRSINRSPSNVALYTVPAEHILFITSGWLTIEEGNDAESTTGELMMVIDIGGLGGGVDRAIMSVAEKHIAGQSGGFGSVTATFNIPIKVMGGERVYLDADNVWTDYISGGFVGFLMKIGDIPQL